jgi:polysaccharide export outer membrane protein
MRLEALWVERSRDRSFKGFGVGPGDILEVSVPDMEPLRGREATVSADGTIILPVIGVVRVAGLTDSQVKVALERDLSKYMRDPDVDIHIKGYNSREVAVVGLVQKPGLYTLASYSDTILGMITKAGGMTENASPRIIFVPAPEGEQILPIDRFAAATESSTISRLNSRRTESASPTAAIEAASASEQPLQPSSLSNIDAVGTAAREVKQSDEMDLSLMQERPIQIDLTDSKRARTFINLPARPGDVILVPATGEVMVQGWVKNPGAFRITQGMTALGAITAAGGEQFSSSAVVLRKGLDEVKVELPIDLSKVKRGEQPDVPVQSGDVVVVNSSTIGAVPYLAYSLFSRFGTGAYVPIPF